MNKFAIVFAVIALSGLGMASQASAKTGPGFTRLPPSAPAVPEPGTWAMMLVGFGSLGVALRVRKRKALTA
jgi:hypothetical protein